MNFAAPQFFLLVPALLIVAWFFRRLELWRPLRAVLLLLLVLILTDPLLIRKSGGLDLWVLVDRSLSAEPMVEKGIQEWRGLLEKSRPTRRDHLHLVDYAAEVVPRPNTETTVYPGDRSLTRTGLAIQDVLARINQKHHNRLLVFTDGYSTEPLTGVAEKLIQSEVPLDFRELHREEAADYRIVEVKAPGRVQIGEPFVMDITLAGKPDATVPLGVFRSGKKILSRNVSVTGGLGRFRFSDRIVEPGAHRYTAQISPQEDAFPGNNSYQNWIQIVSGPRIILVSKYSDDPVIPILRAQGFDVVSLSDPFTLNPGMLTGARAVIFNNIPAWEVPVDFQEALTFFVKEQGGGFLMAGGKFSFGSGGYYESAVDPLLPVSMELKSEHRKLAVAMAIVMDRSGSMAVTVGGGHSKMQLADEGAARAVELLGDMDAITVYAVDSKAHEIAPLLNVGDNRGDLIKRIRGIESMGGGIFVYTGMKEAWTKLKTSRAGQRHMILFSDANDSEKPGDYQNLLAEMRKENATVSVIGLGTRADSDAAFLEDIAKRGGGRMFFSNNAGDLPNIFAQETVSVARSAFVEDPVGTQATGNWYEISNKDLDWLAEVDGYNLSYIREGDTSPLITTDSYKAPLVAYGRRGIGHTGAVSFPLGGEFSRLTRNWPEVGDFLQTFIRWLMGESVPPGIGIRQELKGTELTVDLLFDQDDWRKRFALKPPRLLLNRGESHGETSELTWDRIAPGHYSVKTEVREGEMIRGAVQLGKSAIPFGPLVVGSSSEWAFDPERVAELRETARTSGGRELVDLKDAWKKPPTPGFTGIRSWLFLAALGIFLAEALATRTGWRMPRFSRLIKSRPRKARTTTNGEDRAITPTEEETKEVSPPKTDPVSREESPETQQEKRKRRFARAKKRR